MAYGSIRDLFPELSKELSNLLRDMGKGELADQVESLSVIDKCRCGDGFCSSFYTASKPGGAWGPNHENVSLTTQDGMLMLDVVDGNISYVEVLDRPDFKVILDGAVR